MNRDYDRAVRMPSDSTRRVKLKEGLTEEDALALEVTLIKFWGRKSEGGVLYNLTEGGEGASGYIHTEESREKISASCKGLQTHWKGRRHSEETKKKISEAQKHQERKSGGKSKGGKSI